MKYPIEKVKQILLEKKIATIKTLKSELGTNVSMTIFRKLKDIDYMTSYSHRGKYYSLKNIASFDDFGIWEIDSIYFSKYGSLIETIKNLINISEYGYTSKELKEILHVEVKETLITLIKRNHIYRKKSSGIYIYYNVDPTIQKKQAAHRHNKDIDFSKNISNLDDDYLANEVKAAIILFFSLLDEKQRRLYAGLESIKIGYGGDSKISNLFGINPHTVAKGRNELLEQDIEIDRIRKKGGGRNSQEKKLLR